ncbi:FF domain protein [Cordyceps fumosorosea ARSEF 2679]|uniref:FF domain protein n=1 Tax=Cordyceps fumosorosea (strain ARSEF 2679) TaxID=1081104 RepID=A0A168B619_CORFA|nr:FF domain protein [Cordyceps fumosorosea ARSEF 2679]OAA69670.1 FF domain protein [Cordyceps fumosorosea ARSEF 2679]
MLKSTYVPSAAAAASNAPLPPDWTEHTAPTGHTYYYNAETRESTYKRPGAPPTPEPTPQQPQSYLPYAGMPSLADPKVANAFLAQHNRGPQQQQHQRQDHGKGATRPRPQPIDKPRRKVPIPGHEPWILVYTKYSRRFVYNSAKNASYWRIPEKLMPAILEMDKKRIQQKATGDQDTAEGQGDDAGDGSEYEEVEVTDDEGDGENDVETHPNKRLRTGDTDNDDPEEREEELEQDAGPLEFTEDDIAMQLQMMGEEYGLEPGEYDDGSNPQDLPDGAEGLAFSQEESELLFADLLDDLRVSPYSSWEKLLEDGKMVDDPRYTALATTKARKECHDRWSRARIAEHKAQRAQQAKRDPRVAYLALLQDKATPKLYWPEFKRKYRKDEAMRDAALPDKDREKLYREHINRLKMPPATLRADLTALLRAQPVAQLNSASVGNDALPSAVLADVRYISLPPSVRDPLIEALVQSLPPPPAPQST